MTESPKPPADFPLILPDDVFDTAIYEPISSLVSYVNILFQNGFTDEMVPRDFVDLYLLDYHNGQVRNGGHSQFVHNSHDHLETNLTRGLRAAQMLGIPDLESILERCAAWCRNNPDEAAKQTGFDVRAEALNALDGELYALKFDVTDLDAHLESVPRHLANELRAKLVPPADVTQITDRYVATALEKSAQGPIEDGIIEALPLLDPLFAWKRKSAGIGGEKHAREMMSLGMTRFEEASTEDIEAELRDRVQKHFLDPGLYDDSLYHVKTWCWLASHPMLELVPRAECRARIEALAAQNPMARHEVARRNWQALQDLFADEEAATLGALLGEALPDPTGHGKRELLYGEKDEESARRSQKFKIGSQHIFVVTQGGLMRVCAPKPNWKKQYGLPLMQAARRFGLMSGSGLLKWMTKTRDEVPGKVLAEGPADQGLAALCRELYLPEALGAFWSTDDPRERHDRMVYAGRAILYNIDRNAPSLVWRLENAEGPVLFEASAAGIEITGLGRSLSLSRADLEALRVPEAYVAEEP